MYSPKYTINNTILKNIGQIEACREVIENAPLVPAYEKRFREQAVARTVHHGTHIEGNDLSFDQAQRVIKNLPEENKEGKAADAKHAAERAGLVARERDVQEIINYRQVMDWLDNQWSVKKRDRARFHYTEAQIRRIHELIVNNLIPEQGRGVYRKTQVILRDSRTGKITFRPPPAVEVPYLVEDLIEWLNSREEEPSHPIIRSSVAHYALAAIHPFVDGNGRTARAFATLVLFVEGYDIKRLFSLEEYFDKNAADYYQALIDTSETSPSFPERDLTGWISYFTKGLAVELTKIRDTIRKISIDLKVKKRRGRQVALTERQMKLVEFLAENTRGVMSQLKEIFPMVSEDTVLRDLQAMVKKGIIRKRGKTKGSFYELVT